MINKRILDDACLMGAVYNALLVGYEVEQVSADSLDALSAATSAFLARLSASQLVKVVRRGCKAVIVYRSKEA